MKNLKVLPLLATVAFMFIGLTATAAFAQTGPANVELSQLVPNDIDTYMEFNNKAKNPLSDLFTKGFIAGFESGANKTETPQQTKAIEDLMVNIINNTTYAMATKSSTTGDVDTYIALHISEADYTKLKMLLGPTTNTPNMTTFGDLFVITSKPELVAKMQDLLNKNPGMSLAQSQAYQTVRSKDLPGSFLNAYINPSSQFKNLGDTMGIFDGSTWLSPQKELLDIIKAEGISLAQTSTGFNFSVYVNGDSQKLTQMNLTFDRFTLIPDLYHSIKSQNVIYFSEQSNLADTIVDLFKIYAAKTDFKSWLKTELALDFDNELQPLLKEKYTTSVHKTNQIYPAFTFMLDVRNDLARTKSSSTPQKAEGALNKVVNYIDKTMNKMEKDQGVDFYNMNSTTLNGKTFYQMTFDPTKFVDTDPSIKKLAREKTLFTVNAGITPEGFLIITTAPNPSDVYTTDNKGMLNNATFNSAFTNRDELTSGVSYLSFDTLSSYVTMMMNDFNAPAEAHDFVGKLLSPWHDLYSKSYATSSSVLAKGFVNVDTVGLSKYADLFQQLTETFPQMEEFPGMDMPGMPDMTEGRFCDVHSSDWFAPYINDLADNGVVNGYNDGCFRPGNQITRAEFIKMAMVSSGMDTSPYRGKPYFKDIKTDGSQWYGDVVNMAAESKLTNGYPDGTFRPNAPITRAEAIQMLYNMSTTLKQTNYYGASIMSLNHFSDVTLNDWFMPAVIAANQHDLVQGETASKFAPNRNLTRAEAAKIISLFRAMVMDEQGGQVSSPVLTF